LPFEVSGPDGVWVRHGCLTKAWMPRVRPPASRLDQPMPFEQLRRGGTSG
jgi:hypothetical protein